MSPESRQKHEAFRWLERACEERFPWMDNPAVEARLSSIHSDPRFAALLKKTVLKMLMWKDGTMLE